MYAYERGRDLTATFLECGVAYAYACQHGVLMAYLATQPRLDELDPVPICSISGASRGEIISCWHGLGHGVAEQIFPAEQQALKMCEKTTDNSSQRSCMDAVFTVSVERAIVEDGAGIRSVANPFAPCDQLSQAQAGPCMRAQVSWLEFISNNRLGDTGKLCAEAPSGLRRDCYESLGDHVRFRMHDDAEAAYEFCRARVPQAADRCTLGAISYPPLPHDKVFPLCARLASAEQQECYILVASKLVIQVTDLRERARLCELLPREVRPVCA